MTIRIVALAAFFGAAIAAQANAAQVIHAGDWETTMDGGPAHHTCMSTDHALDQATINKTLASAGLKCAPVDWHQAGNATTYVSVCDVAGGKLTTNSVMTTTGPDSYTTHSKSHLVGGQMKMPDMDMTQTARRDGPCTPGEKPSKF
jgi:opacity protein-like surface antigen